MKTRIDRFTSVFLTVGFLAVFAFGETPTADSLLKPALQSSSQSNKSVFVHFGASWCKWCKELDAMLHSREVGALMSKHYVFVNLTVQESDDKKALENPGAQAFMDGLGGGKSGVPYYAFLDKDGKKLADSNALPKGVNVGYPATAEEISAFSGLLERTAPRMTASERALVTEYLRAHAPTN